MVLYNLQKNLWTKNSFKQLLLLKTVQQIVSIFTAKLKYNPYQLFRELLESWNLCFILTVVGAIFLLSSALHWENTIFP